MKKLIIPLLLFLLTAVQNSLFIHLKFLGIVPDIVLTFVICLTLVTGNPWGTVTAVLGGVIVDTFSGGAFGIQSIGYMLSAYLIGNIEGIIYKDNIFVPSIFTFLATIVKEIIVYILLYLTKANVNIYFYLIKVILPLSIYNSILAAIFYRYIYKLANELSLKSLGNFNP